MGDLWVRGQGTGEQPCVVSWWMMAGGAGGGIVGHTTGWLGEEGGVEWATSTGADVG
jgi:hypothetical protein